MCDCQGKTYNIAMCCEPQIKLGPIENYYTKPTIDRMLDEITSAITSGCCITPEQVDEKIEEAISGITVSGVTEEELNEAIASAKTEIEGEIPSLDGYATEQWVEDKHYITGVDLSDYALKSEIPVVPTSNTAFTNDAGYLTEHQSLSGYATEAFVSAFTYDKATIDEKVAGGGSFDPSQYYNKTATDALLDEKADLSAFTAHTSNTTIHVTPEQVANWNAKSDFSGSYNDLTDKPTIPTVPTDISAFNNDVGYITGVDLSNYATKDNLTAATDDMATKTWVGQQGYLTEHQSLTAYSTTEQVNSAITEAVSGKQDTLVSSVNIKTINNESLLGSGNITIQGGGGTDAPISAGTGTNALIENYTGNTAGGDYSHAEGTGTRATGNTSHAEGHNSYAYGQHSHAEGDATTASNDSAHAEGRKTVASGKYSHAEGNYTTADTLYAHSEGYYTVASGQTSHAEGYMTHANGNTSHSEGSATYANGDQSHAEGLHTETNNVAEHASGRYNVSHTGNTTAASTLFSVGNGDEKTRRNAFEIRQNGDIYIRKNNTDVRLQDITPGIWCGTMAEYQQISGSTDNNTIYLIHS